MNVFESFAKNILVASYTDNVASHLAHIIHTDILSRKCCGRRDVLLVGMLGGEKFMYLKLASLFIWQIS